MPRSTEELLDILSLHPHRPDVFLGHHPVTLVQRSYGGQVLAQALLAAGHTVPEGRPVHSLAAHFMRPGDSAEDIVYLVDGLRDGGTFTTRSVTAQQRQGSVFAMTASFKASEAGLEHQDPPPTEVPGPDESRPLIEVMNERFGASPLWHEWDALDVRLAEDSSEDPPGSPARMRVWARTIGPVGDDPLLHQALLAYLSDLTLLSVSTLPHEVLFMSRQMQTASLGHSMWFHRPCRVDQWLLYDMGSPSASNAIGFCQGRLFQDGRLVATCAQDGLIRVVDEREVFS